MPRSVHCRLGEDAIGIAEALELRRDARGGQGPPFRCLECGQPVRAHRGGTTGQAAHFEHINRNPACRLSAPAR